MRIKYRFIGRPFHCFAAPHRCKDDGAHGFPGPCNGEMHSIVVVFGVSGVGSLDTPDRSCCDQVSRNYAVLSSMPAG